MGVLFGSLLWQVPAPFFFSALYRCFIFSDVILFGQQQKVLLSGGNGGEKAPAPLGFWTRLAFDTVWSGHSPDEHTELPFTSASTVNSDSGHRFPCEPL